MSMERNLQQVNRVLCRTICMNTHARTHRLHLVQNLYTFAIIIGKHEGKMRAYRRMKNSNSNKRRENAIRTQNGLLFRRREKKEMKNVRY